MNQIADTRPCDTVRILPSEKTSPREFVTNCDVLEPYQARPVEVN
jgi:hypothetical protein